MTIITNIQIMVWDIKVGEKYYSFKYKTFVDGKLTEESEYEGDHVWGGDKRYFRGHLKNGGAVKCVLERIKL